MTVDILDRLGTVEFSTVGLTVKSCRRTSHQPSRLKQWPRIIVVVVLYLVVVVDEYLATEIKNTNSFSTVLLLLTARTRYSLFV